MLNVNLINEVKPILEFSNIFILFALFLIVNAIALYNRYLYFCLGLILFSQLVYVFHINFITNIIDNIYTLPVSNFTDFRFGGIFGNANHCSKYVTLCLAIF